MEGLRGISRHSTVLQTCLDISEKKTGDKNKRELKHTTIELRVIEAYIILVYVYTPLKIT
jgi:hypothetical protein